MLNITLLIQVGNFGIAYLLFTRIFLKKAVLFVQEKEHTLMKEQQGIDIQNERIAVKIARNEHDWAAMQKNLQQLRPSVDYHFVKAHFYQASEKIDMKSLSEQDIVVLVEETQQVIVDRLEHA